MTLEQMTADLSKDEVVALLGQSQRQIEQLSAQLEEQKRQLDWFKQQLFGRKSERLLQPDGSAQLSLGGPAAAAFGPDKPDAGPTTTVPAHSRRKRGQDHAWATGAGLRFDDSVPVLTIELPNEQMEALQPHEYEVVGLRRTHRLAQRPGSYVVVRYERTAIRLKESGEIVAPTVPPSVLEGSVADVSFLAGLVLDKMAYHLPLHRQHQRLKNSGIELSRTTLSNLVHRTAELLAPIREAQLKSILQSRTLLADETPIKAGRKKKGRMHQGWIWPLLGDSSEVHFHYEPSRGAATVPKLLGDYEGVLVTDGYAAYERYAATLNGVVHARCWAHTRRKFIAAQESEPQLSDQVLRLIGKLYEQEAEILEAGHEEESKLRERALCCRPVVEELFGLLRKSLDERLLLPTSPFSKAASYALQREEGLKVFLDYPDVPVDTNALEREIRPIALGRKNWMFCWSEQGAEVVATLQGLVATCRLQGINPYSYLVDVLQRVGDHPASAVEQLTPRLWKQHFADNPLRSVIDR